MLNRIASGDETAFAELYAQFHLSVFQFVQKFVKSPQLSEDISQEVFVKIWENRSRVEEIQSIKSYLFTIARNHTLNTLKSIGKNEAAIHEIIRHFPTQKNNSEDDLLSQEYQHFLQNTLNSLSPRSREIFSLCRQNGKTYEEVAQQLGISRNAVKNHMVASMKILKAAMEKNFGISFSLLITIINQSN